MAGLFQIVYTSTAVDSLAREDLLDLLNGSVERNRRAGITGVLLYHSGTFMQVLEGDMTAVLNFYAKISRDPRHHHVITLICEPIKERHFLDAGIAFRDLTAPEEEKAEGYTEFLERPSSGELPRSDLPKCRRLLWSFKENIR
jgi:Sensors of blue-light using FAD